MATKVVVDPITRIEGHLRIEVQADGGKITNSWATATMFRGIETIMTGRDPRDAWAYVQRICGVCTTVHAIASIRAVEDALKITVPANAELIRNLVMGAQYVHDHVVHFYHLHALDWVDVVSALSADPAAAARIARSISPWPNNDEAMFRAVQVRLKKFVGSGQLGIFANGYWGHPAYKLPPEVNLIAVSHSLEALDWQRDIVRLHAIFGGKNPHPNFLVGGMASAINLDDTATINAERITDLLDIIKRARQFVEQVYYPDLLAIAGFYKDWGAIGGGVKNYFAVGDFPDGPFNDRSTFYLPHGVILNGNLAEVQDWDHRKVTEEVTSSWYEGEDGKGLHPYEGETKPKYTGPKSYEFLQGEKKYTWMKAPRYDGHSMQTGPLAHMLVAYARGHADVKPLVDDALRQLKVGPEVLFSTLGRTAARGVETVVLARRMEYWMGKLIERIKTGDTATFTKDKWEPSSWPEKAEGYGYMQAPRGGLGHWVQIEDGKISRYQCVVPSTWNCSPRDAKGNMGAYEASLVDNHPLARTEQPLEILRTIHSFDPCLACGVHILDIDGNPLTEVKVQ